MSSKQRKAQPQKAVADAGVTPDALLEEDDDQEEVVAADEAPDEAVAQEEAPALSAPPVPAPASKLCCECGSSHVVVTTGSGAAARDYCAKHAPVNARR